MYLHIIIIDAPEGVEGNSPVYAAVGDDVTITAYVSIDANPLPTFRSWRNLNTKITIYSGGRFNISDDGSRLTIASFTEEDFAIYQVILSNSVGEDLVRTITVVQAGNLI